ncbi:MAG: F0F1 ATP synthase subunit C [Proteobacteria bacterium]|nr:MAG: F0F1 ATP synthase subunit C [Pseudomonadota bacterium]
MKKFFNVFGVLALSVLGIADSAFAEAAGAAGGGNLAIGAGIAIGVAALGGALGQGKAVSAALDSIGRNPSASGKMLVPMVLGLVFMETLVIFSFVIAYFLQGKI